MTSGRRLLQRTCVVELQYTHVYLPTYLPTYLPYYHVSKVKAIHQLLTAS